MKNIKVSTTSRVDCLLSKRLIMHLYSLVVMLIAGVCAAQSQMSAPAPSLAQETSDSTAPRVVDRGANHRLWQWETYEKAPDGRMVPHTHQLTELAAGMHYKDASENWVESQEVIEPYPGGAIARQGQHQVIFANNLNTHSSIDMQTPDGKRLRSNILGLMYYDSSTGDAVLIAELQDSAGELIADNQVLYPNAFNGVRADVKYTYQRGGFEQDVILREQPPAPELFGFNPNTTELEVFTEFIDPPTARVENSDQPEEGQKISWGAVTLGRGKAFNIGGQDQVGVSKRYVTIQGRHFLLEKVSIKAIEKSLAKLPEQASNKRKLPYLASKTPVFPPPRQIVAAQPKMKLAKVNRSAELGYVLDYVTLNASYTNYTFQGDSTYYISGAINLCGTNTFEGGAVIKYAANAAISFVSTPLTPSIVFKTGAYRPVIFTAKDDNSVGEGISGSTGNPSGYYANPALNLQSMGEQTLRDFRISYAAKGLSVSGASPFIYDAQFVKCAVGLSDINGDVALGNVLFTSTKTNFIAASAVNLIDAQHVTFNNSFDFIGGSYANTAIYLTNCLLANVTNVTGTINAGYNGFFRTMPVGDGVVTNTFNPFKVVGAGSCYLTNGCAFLDAGTTNLDSSVSDLIKIRTTQPPVIYSNTIISTVTTFLPQALRDINTPDLGYHYDPLDYVFGASSVAKSNLTFTAGTAVGFFYNSSGGSYSLAVADRAAVSFAGNVSNPCRWTKYSNVQESDNGIWKLKSWLGGITGQSFTYVAPAIRAQFLIGTAPAGEGNFFRDNGALLNVCATNCEFWSGGVAGYYASLNLVNCLLANNNVGLWQNYGAANITMRGCTMIRGYFFAAHSSSGDWPISIMNSAFDQTVFNMYPNSYGTNGAYCDYNSFLLNSNRTYLSGSHDLTITNGYNWQTSWLGAYYLPANSPLINTGSTTADQLALYHFTTQTDQTKEANSTVDIGYHYVAMDSLGNPADTDGDGAPDYQEDVNGNGVFDGEDLSDWLLSPFNGLSGPLKLRVYTPLK